MELYEITRGYRHYQSCRNFTRSFSTTSYTTYDHHSVFRRSTTLRRHNSLRVSRSFNLVSGRQRDHVSLYDSLIDPDPISTEEEWKRYLDRGCLVEKAVEQLRYGIANVVNTV